MQPSTVECKLSRDAQRDTELLHSRLRDIAQAVINDDQNFSTALEERLNSNPNACSSPRSRSPARRQANSKPVSRNGSPFADATYSAVQAALSKRQLQVNQNFSK
jgi:hypothetical protein